MKRGTPDHPKAARLQKALGCSVLEAIGLLEMLFHFTAKYAIQGNIGKWSNAQIAEGVKWPGDPELLIRALVDSEWMDEDPEYRLVVHDWHEHADQSVKKTLANRKLKMIRTMAERAGVSYLYFIRGLESKRIKIGMTTRNPKQRLASLQSASPEPLTCISAFEVAPEVEGHLHKLLEAHQIHGEWFAPHKDVLAVIETCKAAIPPIRVETFHPAGRNDSIQPDLPAFPEPVPVPEPSPEPQEAAAASILIDEIDGVPYAGADRPILPALVNSAANHLRECYDEACHLAEVKGTFRYPFSPVASRKWVRGMIADAGGGQVGHTWVLAITPGDFLAAMVYAKSKNYDMLTRGCVETAQSKREAGVYKAQEREADDAQAQHAREAANLPPAVAGLCKAVGAKTDEELRDIAWGQLPNMDKTPLIDTICKTAGVTKPTERMVHTAKQRWWDQQKGG